MLAMCLTFPITLCFFFFSPRALEIEVFKQWKHTFKYAGFFSSSFFFFFFWLKKWSVHVTEVEEIVSRCGDIHLLLQQICKAHAEVHYTAIAKCCLQNHTFSLVSNTSTFSTHSTNCFLKNKQKTSLKQYQKPSACAYIYIDFSFLTWKLKDTQ